MLGLRNLVWKNPCKVCLVVPVCKSECEDKQIYEAGLYKYIVAEFIAEIFFLVCCVYLAYHLITKFFPSLDCLWYAAFHSVFGFFLIYYIMVLRDKKPGGWASEL